MKRRTSKDTAKGYTPPPRFEYSPEEIQRMLVEIDNVVSACKAEQQGVSRDDMIKTVRGGKVVWITRDEMNRILAKNRKISGRKYAQRSVGGEGSLSSEINRRVQTCRVLLEAIRKAAPDKTTLLTAKLRDLEMVQNRSISLGREVRMLELAIQRKRAEDPLVADIDRATDEMLAALEQQDLAEADLCRMHCDRYSEEYVAKMKRLEPYIKKARECRIQFLIEKRKLYQFEFEVISIGEQILSAQIPEILYRDKEGGSTQALSSLAEEIRSIVERGRPEFEALSDCTEDQLEEQNCALSELDENYLTPLFDKTIKFVESFRRAWQHFVEGVPAPPSEVEPGFDSSREREKAHPYEGMIFRRCNQSEK